MPKVQQLDNGVGGLRARRGRRVSSTLAEINVVPLVDVMLVLLIIFMVTAPMMQRGFDVNLPVAARSQPISEERVFVTVPLSFRNDRVVQLGNEPINIALLQERMRQKLLGAGQKEVFLRGDGGITMQELLDVMDKLKQAGVERVGIVAKLPTEER